MAQMQSLVGKMPPLAFAQDLEVAGLPCLPASLPIEVSISLPVISRYHKEQEQLSDVQLSPPTSFALPPAYQMQINALKQKM